MVLYDPQRFPEPLEMHHFSGSEKTKRFRHFRVLDQPKQIIVRSPGFLFCSQIFRKVRYHISFRLKFAGVERNPPCCLGPEGRCVVHIIFVKAGSFQFFHGHVLCKLVNYGTYHFKMCQFAGPRTFLFFLSPDGPAPPGQY